jgi:hypothetical protein
MTTAYPLAWPDGWPRMPPLKIVDGKHRFRRNGHHTGNPYWTFGAARDALLEELRRLGARHVVISSNFKTDRREGIPVEGSRRPQDQGIAVYFMLDGEPRTMARDAYMRAEENFRDLTLAIQAMRQLELHGGPAMMKRAFQGFAALPPPRSHWDILGLERGAGEAEIRRAYRAKAAAAHPDVAGGSTASMAEINAARDAALKELGAK